MNESDWVCEWWLHIFQIFYQIQFKFFNFPFHCISQSFITIGTSSIEHRAYMQWWMMIHFYKNHRFVWPHVHHSVSSAVFPAISRRSLFGRKNSLRMSKRILFNYYLYFPKLKHHNNSMLLFVTQLFALLMLFMADKSFVARTNYSFNFLTEYIMKMSFRTIITEKKRKKIFCCGKLCKHGNRLTVCFSENFTSPERNTLKQWNTKRFCVLSVHDCMTIGSSVFVSL